METGAGRKRKTPVLSTQCPVQLECQVKEILPLGSHDLFLGRLWRSMSKKRVQKEKGRIDISKAHPFVFCPGANDIWNLGKVLGHYGFTKGKP